MSLPPNSHTCNHVASVHTVCSQFVSSVINIFFDYYISDDTQLQYILGAVGGETTPHKRKEKGNKGEVQKQSINDKIKYIRELLPHLEEEFIKVHIAIR